MSDKAVPDRPGRPSRPPPALRSEWALFLDIDGTLLDIAESPDEVSVPPVLRSHLSAIERALDGAVALVSGRPISDIDRLFSPLRLAASGQHGGEWRPEPLRATEVVASQPVPPGLREAADALRWLDPSIVVEQKSHAVAVHYRHVPDLGPELGSRLARAMEGVEGLMLISGRMVWEVKDATQSKGTAVARFMAQPRFAGRIPVFIGDDTTDEDGFRAVKAMGGIALPVGPRLQSWADPELPGFSDPMAVRLWLADFAAAHNPANSEVLR